MTRGVKAFWLLVIGGASIIAFLLAGTGIGPNGAKWNPSLLVMAMVLTGITIGILFVKPPKTHAKPALRVKGARVPSYRMVCVTEELEGEVCILELGRRTVRILLDDGTVLIRFAREWADVAMRLPGFLSRTSGTHLAVVDSSWSAPTDAPLGFFRDLWDDFQTLYGGPQAEANWLFFECDADLRRTIKDYCGRTLEELGSLAAPRYYALAQRQIRMGTTGFVVGGMLALTCGILVLLHVLGPDDQEAIGRFGAIGAFVAAMGGFRFAQGWRTRRKAQVSEWIEPPGPSSSKRMRRDIDESEP